MFKPEKQQLVWLNFRFLIPGFCHMKEEGRVTPVSQTAQPEVQLRPLRPRALTSRPACPPFN